MVVPCSRQREVTRLAQRYTNSTYPNGKHFKQSTRPTCFLNLYRRKVSDMPRVSLSHFATWVSVGRTSPLSGLTPRRPPYTPPARRATPLDVEIRPPKLPIHSTKLHNRLLKLRSGRRS